VEPPKPSAGALVGGIIVGLVVGGAVLFLVTFLGVGAIASNFGKNDTAPVFIACYVIAVGVGAWGLVLGRASSGFWTGLLIGSAIGMLGITALCNTTIAGFGNGGIR
jgi:hypothetical protein